MRGWALGFAEGFAGWFLPPACREEVLGDLFESCASVRRYLASATQVVPRVILSQIRRNTDLHVFLFTALAIVYSFAAGSYGLATDIDHRILRLAIPTIPTLLALLIRNGFAPLVERRLHAVTFDIGMAMAAAALSQFILLMTLQNGLMLPDWCPSEASALCWMFIILLRALFPPGTKLHVDQVTD